jgi:peptidoglycan/LPS O-acetylase OafA/YrhL
MKRRVLRVVPIYWLLTAFKSAVALIAPSEFFGYRFALGHSLGSFFFLPVKDMSGEVFPVVKVGWTLVYEMVFYFVFAVCLLVSTRRPHIITIGIGSMLAIAGFLHPFASAFAATYTDPLLVEFAFGCIIALVADRAKMAT